MSSFMNPLQQKIIQKIKDDGPITFKTFMEMALYESELGYYTSQNTKIGRAGDFYTSSHLHPVFGKMIGKQIEEMWEIMGRPDDFQIVEMGAGIGYICKDMLEYLSDARCTIHDSRFKIQDSRKERDIFKHLQYIIVELNPAMREQQKNLLSNFLNKVRWISSLRELNNIKSCILSNELLDSFPVHLIEMEEEVEEIYVGTENERLIEIKKHPSTNAIFDYLKEFSIELPKGYRTEINLEIKNWLNDINNVLAEGFIFMIDYGYPSWDYYGEDRNRGTLLCYYRHQIVEDPYQNIGEQDITAHVNFSSIKKWGEELGIKTIGFCQQGTFLISLGIDEEIAKLHEESNDYLFEVARIKKLILPGTMGETHKVMIQYKDSGEPKLRGFLFKNQKGKL
jgi:SAM-dependent MidA family methyltransferase